MGKRDLNSTIKALLQIFYKMDWNGGATPTQNSVTPKTTGSGHARRKRPCNGNQFCTQQKIQYEQDIIFAFHRF